MDGVAGDEKRKGPLVTIRESLDNEGVTHKKGDNPTRFYRHLEHQKAGRQQHTQVRGGQDNSPIPWFLCKKGVKKKDVQGSGYEKSLGHLTWMVISPEMRGLPPPHQVR